MYEHHFKYSLNFLLHCIYVPIYYYVYYISLFRTNSIFNHWYQTTTAITWSQSRKLHPDQDEFRKVNFQIGHIGNRTRKPQHTVLLWAPDEPLSHRVRYVLCMCQERYLLLLHWIFTSITS